MLHEHDSTRSVERGANLAEHTRAGKEIGGEFINAQRHSDASSVAPLSALPGSRLADAVTGLLVQVETSAAQHGYFLAMERANRALRSEPELVRLHSRERRFVTDALHQIVRGLRRLRKLTAGAGKATLQQVYAAWICETVGPPDEPLPAEVTRALSRVGLSADAVQGRRAFLAERLATLETQSRDEQVESLGDALSYPSWLVRRLLSETEPSSPAASSVLRTLQILAAQNGRAPLTIRVNRVLTSRQAAAQQLQNEGIASTPTPWAREGLWLQGHKNVYATQAFAQGLFELQDEGSQLIAELCAPSVNSVVVDLCAGAGGKTLALGSLLGNRGRLVALDVGKSKLAELSRRVRRAGLSNVQTVTLPTDWLSDGGAQVIPDWLRQRGAERVLVDAPCTGLGVLRRNAEARWRLRETDIDELCTLQAQLVSAASTLVRPGGWLIYATCSVLRAENEDRIAAFLTAHPDYKLLPAKEILGAERSRHVCDASGQYLHTMPSAEDPHAPDGFFAAVLRRVAS